MQVRDVLNWDSTRATRKKTDFIAVHCSATQASADIGAAEINKWHIAKGWQGIGYHFVIRRDGSVERGEALEKLGAHVEGFNAVSVGVCMVGGIGVHGAPEANFTPAQWASLGVLLHDLNRKYPKAIIKGHRDFSPDLNHDGIIEKREWMKDCPCFDVADFWNRIK